MRSTGSNVVTILGALFLLFCASGVILAQEAPNDTDPSKIVFFSLREEYYNLNGDGWINRVIYRSDKAIFKKSRFASPKGVTLRWDLPLVTTHLGSETTTGLGDLYFHALFFPRFRKGLNLALGPGLILPTATDDLLGQGKWQIAPLAVPIWYFSKGRGFFLVKFQDFVSFAGDEERPDTHFLLTTPALFWRLNAKSWIVVDTEAQTDWKTDRTSVKSGLQLGRTLTKQLAFWVKPEFYWGPNNQGDWGLKFTMLWIQ